MNEMIIKEGEEWERMIGRGTEDGKGGGRGEEGMGDRLEWLRRKEEEKKI